LATPVCPPFRNTRRAASKFRSQTTTIKPQNKMKTMLFLLLTLAAVIDVSTIHAQPAASAPPAAVTSTNAGGVTLTPDQINQLNSGIDGLIPLIPAQYKPVVAKIIGWLATIAVIGRVLVGFVTAGPWGAIASLLFGHKPNPADSSKTSQGAGARSGFGVLALLLIPCGLLFLGTGCKSTQIVTFTKGTGLDLNIPLGYNGNNIFEMRMRFGQFYTADAYMPVSTNALYSPKIALSSGTQGAVTAPSLGSVGGSNSVIAASQTPANVAGGDFFNAVLGGGNSSVSNVISKAEANIGQ
jgi:hypothetical protein